MGWTFMRNTTKEQLVKECTASGVGSDGRTYRCLEHSLRGNHLWTLWEKTGQDGGVEVAIGLDLLAKKGGEWGYKSMSEASHPYYYDCPQKFLKKAPVKCQEWRDKVLRAVALKKQLKDLRVGDIIYLFDKEYVVAHLKATPKKILVFGPRNNLNEEYDYYGVKPISVERVIRGSVPTWYDAASQEAKEIVDKLRENC